jgi:hypothetical protein
VHKPIFRIIYSGCHVLPFPNSYNVDVGSCSTCVPRRRTSHPPSRVGNTLELLIILGVLWTISETALEQNPGSHGRNDQGPLPCSSPPLPTTLNRVTFTCRLGSLGIIIRSSDGPSIQRTRARTRKVPSARQICAYTREEGSDR